MYLEINPDVGACALQGSKQGQRSGNWHTRVSILPGRGVIIWFSCITFLLTRRKSAFLQLTCFPTRSMTEYAVPLNEALE